MAAPLSLKVQTARHAAPYSDTQTGTYSQAFSLNPSGLQVFSKKNNFSEKRNSDNFISMSNLCKYMNTEENESGEYHTLDSKIWELLPITRKTDSRGRINTGSESFYGKEVRVFIADVAQEPEKCKSYLLLPKSLFSEVRKSRVKDQIGEPLKVQKNGDLWTTQKEKYVKIFVRK